MEQGHSHYSAVSLFWCCQTQPLCIPSNISLCMCVSCSVRSDSLWPMNCSPPSSLVHGILQARIVEWVAISYSRGSFRPSDWTHIYRIAVRFWTTAPPGLKMLCSTWSHILQQNSLSLFLWRRQGSFNNNNNNYKCVKSLGPWLKMGPPLPTFCWTN